MYLIYYKVVLLVTIEVYDSKDLGNYVLLKLIQGYFLHNLSVWLALIEVYDSYHEGVSLSQAKEYLLG